jgi:haloalkane dehalogenase
MPSASPSSPLVLRTPDAAFDALAGYGFEPHYVEIPDPDLGPLRMHHVDEGPRDADPVVLLHGQPTWSYMWRDTIRALVAAGHRVVAPDLIGFGRSDKPAHPHDHSYAAHVARTRQLFAALDLHRVTLVVHDWGGPIGLSVLANETQRFARVVATNTIVHTSDPSLAGELAWANHADGDGHVVLQTELVDYILLTQRLHEITPSLFVRFGTATPPAADVLAAYDAPFPDPSYCAGPRQFPVLIPLTPTDPGAAIGRETWSVLERWDRPFLTAFSDGDPPSRGWDRIFRRHPAPAAGVDHVTIAGAGHFVPEEKGAELGDRVARFIEATPPS